MAAPSGLFGNAAARCSCRYACSSPGSAEPAPAEGSVVPSSARSPGAHPRKIAASKRKGMWMGGYPPLGFHVRDRRLVINDAEAAQVIDIYKLYLELGSGRLLQREMDRGGGVF